LRDAQEHAIPLLVQGGGDLIIAASTASGKTEAALLPILTRMADQADALLIYISPLKALINDQWRRMEELGGLLDIPVTPWHGDITQTRKIRFLKEPKGCLLITPESLEALLIRHGHELRRILGGLQFVVVDELHAFMGTERGKQLQSLLHRIDQTLARQPRRIGLSATLGDMDAAKEFLHPDSGKHVDLVESKEGGQELRVLVKGVLEPDSPPLPAGSREEELRDSPAKIAIVGDLYMTLRRSNNLVFPNSRSEVEFYSDRLRKRCEEERVPNEFWPHHGNLAKEIREETEAALKQKELPATAICTSTLELGIDIGTVKSVVQIGPPPSVASLRQRLGRSGRRKGEPAILRGYMVEQELTSRSGLSDLLHERLVQMIAMVQLLVKGWYEPINVHGLHASTLVQQLLSALSQYGGLYPGQVWALLCGSGPFRAVPKDAFLSLLRALGEQEIIFQDSTGLLLLAPKGEHITENYHFYAAFSSDEEYRIVTTGKTLGSLPISRPLTEGSFVIFAGRRWIVLSISVEEKVIEVAPAKGGTVPCFEGTACAAIHDQVREAMREILRVREPIPFLDSMGQKLLEEARDNYARLELDTTWLRETNNQVQILLWKGDRINDTLLMMLMARNFKGSNEGLFVSLEGTSINDVRMALSQIVKTSEVEPQDLARNVKNKIREKWDSLLPDDFLNVSFASSYIDEHGVIRSLEVALALPE
jgi:ATP-dependent Lhr-like helicase